MIPKYTLDNIKFSTDQPTFQRAVKLYQQGKVTQFKLGISSYTAVVNSTKLYHVFVENRSFKYSDCNCYLGEKDTLCKHIVAVAIHIVKQGKPLKPDEIQQHHQPKCSGKRGQLSVTKLKNIKTQITSAVRYIKPYNGPSRIWFQYQNSLDEGCNRLSSIICELPVSKQTSDMLVKLLLRLDKKLTTGGVDDSNGTVGGFIEETVEVLKKFAKLDRDCLQSFSLLKNQSTCFDWEYPLLDLIEK